MIRFLSAGDRALLIEFSDLASLTSLTEQLRLEPPPGALDLLPAERTLLVTTQSGADLARLRRAITATIEREPPARDTVAELLAPVTIGVRYDGPDLADVARLTRRSKQEVIAQHTATLWRCAFIGFAPGFSYLVSDDTGPEVPRRQQSRTSVPAGSVGLAGRYSAVYPRASPGGWQLIGSTEVAMWDLAAEPPATAPVGALVRFVNVDEL